MSLDIDKPKRGRPRVCRAYPNTGKHKFDQIQTERCQNGQWQNVCACGEMTDDQVWGEVVAEEPAALTGREINLDDKLDVDLIVDALFDNNLNWTEAILQVGAAVDAKQARALAEDWSIDKRLTAAIELYVKSLSDPTMGYALLIHHTRKASSDPKATGAVKATAMNVQKSAFVTEKSEQHFSGPMLIQGLEEGLKRMMGGSDTPADEPETTSPTKLVQ